MCTNPVFNMSQTAHQVKRELSQLTRTKKSRYSIPFCKMKFHFIEHGIQGNTLGARCDERVVGEVLAVPQSFQ